MWLQLCHYSIYSTPRLSILLMHETIGATGLVVLGDLKLGVCVAGGIVTENMAWW